LKKRTIIFRADGGPEIGMGHFIRTLALAEMLNEEFHCIYATRKPTEYLVEEIEKICHGRIDLPEDDSHFNDFLEHLGGDEIVVLDNYYFDTDYQRSIKTLGCKLVCIDDMHDKHYVADIVINHAPIVNNLFSVEPYTKMLIGFEYALIRSEFFKSAKTIQQNLSLQHVLICLGGDHNNLTLSFLKDLVKIDKINKVSIITGEAYGYKTKLHQEINNLNEIKKITWHLNINAKGVKKVMQDADFGIVPCSTVLIEAISQNLPVITGYFVKNQMEISRKIKDKYCSIKEVGDLNNVLISESLINELETNLATNKSYQIISNSGRLKIQKEFKILDKEFELDLRKAKLDNIDIYFNWANDSAVRENAIGTKAIPYKNHVEWFKNKLENEHTVMFILYENDEAVGQIRFDYKDTYYLIDYSIDVSSRGQGYGSVIVKKGIEKLTSLISNQTGYKVKAVVKTSNRASAKVFINLNFMNTQQKQISGSNYSVFEKLIQ
jgi:UDP-2,4-diacetamido-2,4,6-trideoxy-beta-L-altropyranose hydrolase